MNNNIMKKPLSLLILSYKQLEFDGRLQRLIELFKKYGRIWLYDVIENKSKDYIGNEIIRKSYIIKKRSKYYNHFLFLLNCLKEIIAIKPDYIVSSNYFTIHIGMIGALIIRRRFIYDAHELIFDQAEIKSLRDKFWFFIEKICIKKAYLVIAANEERAKLMLDYYRLKSLPIIVKNIPFFDSNREEINFISNTKQLYLSKEKKIVLYQGNLDENRGIKRFIQSINFLPDNYVIVLVGDGPDKKKLESFGQILIEKKRLFLMGRINHRSLINITKIADVGIVCYPYYGLNNIFCSPNKVYEYCQAFVPIIATSQFCIKKIIEKYRIGEIVNKDDNPNDIAKIIIYIVNNKDLYIKNIKNFLLHESWNKEKLNAQKILDKYI